MDLAQRRESAQVIARNARMLLKHVNDLLDMSKLEAGKLKIELQDTDVAALVRFLASHFAVLAAERKIDYVVERGRAVRGGRRSRQAAARPDEPAWRTRSSSSRTAAAFAARSGNRRRELTVSVDDSGPGVKPELRQAIFERFRQGDGGTNRKTGGTGLGLAIAKEFVEMHKGRIEVLDSDLGGARFQVTMPLHRLRYRARAARLARTMRRLDRTLLDGLIEELRPSASQSTEPRTRLQHGSREAAGPRGRGQPRHEPVRHPVPVGAITR